MQITDQEKLAWLGLVWGAGVGPAGFGRVLATYGTASAALQASAPELVSGKAHLRPEQAALIPHLQDDLQSYAAEYDELVASGSHVLFATDSDYPAIFRDLSHPPPVLCVAGDILPQDDFAIALVGTRTPTRQGADLAQDLAVAAVEEGFTVVSGLAHGIDTAAHRGALQANGRTIAILGSGLRVVFPEENGALAEDITQSGALVSELPPGAAPTLPGLMARNRLISLMSRAVIVVECRQVGGSLSTAQAAMQQKRSLYAVNWPTPHEQDSGNRQLLSIAAQPLRCAADMKGVCASSRGPRPAPRHGTAETSQLPLF